MGLWKLSNCPHYMGEIYLIFLSQKFFLNFAISFQVTMMFATLLVVYPGYYCWSHYRCVLRSRLHFLLWDFFWLAAYVLYISKYHLRINFLLTANFQNRRSRFHHLHACERNHSLQSTSRISRHFVNGTSPAVDEDARVCTFQRSEFC